MSGLTTHTIMFTQISTDYFGLYQIRVDSVIFCEIELDELVSHCKHGCFYCVRLASH